MTTPQPSPQRGHASHGEPVIVRCLNGTEPEHRARNFVTHVLPQIGLGEVFEVELAIHELVANARQHASGPYELRLYISTTGFKIAVVDGGSDHAELARRLLKARSDQPTARESGRGLQLVAGLFPGHCGAEPTTTCMGREPAKQLWITVPTDGEPWKEPGMGNLNESERQAVQLSQDLRARIDTWLAGLGMSGSLAVSPYVDPRTGPSILITANADVARALALGLGAHDQRPVPHQPGPVPDGHGPCPVAIPPGQAGHY